MDLIDLTQPLQDNMCVFPQDPPFSIKKHFTYSKDNFSLSIMQTGLHTGTHLDAPFHFDPEGRKVDEIDLNELIGTARILNIKEKIITENVLQKHLQPTDSPKIILINTGWSKKWNLDNYFTHNPYLTEDAAEFLIKKRIKGLGIDCPSVDLFGETSIHKKLLSQDIWIVENLTNLKEIKTESIEINIIPLPLHTEASPVRVFAKL